MKTKIQTKSTQANLISTNDRTMIIPTTLTTKGNISITNLSNIRSKDLVNLPILCTNDPEKLFEKKLYECLIT